MLAGEFNKVSTYEKKALGFLDLPGGIRNKIYRLLLLSDNASKEEPYKHRRATRYELSLGLLGVNRQIWEEVYGILYRKNIWIDMRIDETIIIDEQTGKFLPVVSRKRFNCMELPALTIDLGFVDQPSGDMVDIVIGIQGIDYLIDILWKLIANHPTPSSDTIGDLSISFSLGRTPVCTGPELEERLLLPFANVLSCGHVSVKGTTTSFADYFWSCMHRPPVNTSMIEETLQGFLDRGDEAFRANRVDKACFQYKHAFHFMRHMQQPPVFATPAQINLVNAVFFRSSLRHAKTFVILSVCNQACGCLDMIANLKDNASTYEEILWNLYRAFAMIGDQVSRRTVVPSTLTQLNSVSTEAAVSFLDGMDTSGRRPCRDT